MKYLLLFLAAPAAASFIVQCILCCKIRNRILRHGTLILPAALFVSGAITLMTQHGDIFSGLGVIEAVLWFTGGCCRIMSWQADGTGTVMLHCFRQTCRLWALQKRRRSSMPGLSPGHVEQQLPSSRLKKKEKENPYMRLPISGWSCRLDGKAAILQKKMIPV